MRRVDPILALLVLALAATPVYAGGINMRWDRCFGDGGVSNKAFACNTNTGTSILVGSFVLDSSLPLVSSNEFTIDLTTAAPTLPAWWQFKNAGTCRQGSLAFNTVANSNDVVCQDWAQGQSIGGIASYTVGFQGPYTAQIRGVLAVAAGAATDLPGGQEYFSFNVTINRQKTVGIGSCSGCNIPTCLALSSMKINSGDGSTFVTLTTPANGGNSNYVSWQGGDGVVPFANGFCAGFDTAGFAINTTVVGRGSVVRSRIKSQYPAGSPITLTAQPQPGARFVSWSGDTTTTAATLNVVVTHTLNYTATFDKDPAGAPHVSAVTDYPDDQGSLVLVGWDPSPIEAASPGFISNYQIQRRPPAPPGAPWVADASYPAMLAPSYTFAAGTPADSTGTDPALFEFRVVALGPDTLAWVSNEVTGHSVDNLAPPSPSSVSGTISSGFATLFWPAVSAPDLAHYAIYRALDAPPPIDAAHRIATTTFLGYSDSPGAFAHYGVTAVDVHGNESVPTAMVPSNTAGVDGRPMPRAFTVGNPTPSPMASSMSIWLGLPREMSVSVEVMDAQGRLLRSLRDGVASAGWLTVSWDARDAQGRRAAAGIYFVRVHTPAGEQIRRLALLP